MAGCLPSFEPPKFERPSVGCLLFDGEEGDIVDYFFFWSKVPACVDFQAYESHRSCLHRLPSYRRHHPCLWTSKWVPFYYIHICVFDLLSKIISSTCTFLKRHEKDTWWSPESTPIIIQMKVALPLGRVSSFFHLGSPERCPTSDFLKTENRARIAQIHRLYLYLVWCECIRGYLCVYEDISVYIFMCLYVLICVYMRKKLCEYMFSLSPPFWIIRWCRAWMSP